MIHRLSTSSVGFGTVAARIARLTPDASGVERVDLQAAIARRAGTAGPALSRTARLDAVSRPFSAAWGKAVWVPQDASAAWGSSAAQCAAWGNLLPLAEN